MLRRPADVAPSWELAGKSDRVHARLALNRWKGKFGCPRLEIKPIADVKAFAALATSVGQHVVRSVVAQATGQSQGPNRAIVLLPWPVACTAAGVGTLPGVRRITGRWLCSFGHGFLFGGFWRPTSPMIKFYWYSRHDNCNYHTIRLNANLVALYRPHKNSRMKSMTCLPVPVGVKVSNSVQTARSTGQHGD